MQKYLYKLRNIYLLIEYLGEIFRKLILKHLEYGNTTNAMRQREDKLLWDADFPKSVIFDCEQTEPLSFYIFPQIRRKDSPAPHSPRRLNR